jgi:Domain of unknown function (DUF4159)
MREYLYGRGFFMCDDFHGAAESAVFLRSMQRVFPDRPVLDIPNEEAIFHVVYHLHNAIRFPERDPCAAAVRRLCCNVLTIR